VLPDVIGGDDQRRLENPAGQLRSDGAGPLVRENLDPRAAALAVLSPDTLKRLVVNRGGITTVA
jgi:hypothetical protein